MADTPDTRSRTSPPEERREAQASARTPRMMRRDLFDLPRHPFMRRMQDNLDRIFSGHHDWPSLFSEGSHTDWTPAIETFQRGNEFIVRAELPGLSRKDLTIDVGDDVITLTGERAYDHDEEHEGVYRSERAYGAFRRTIGLPEGALSETAKATFKDGVLEIRMQSPSRTTRQGRRLEITEEDAQSFKR